MTTKPFTETKPHRKITKFKLSLYVCFSVFQLSNLEQLCICFMFLFSAWTSGYMSFAVLIVCGYGARRHKQRQSVLMSVWIRCVFHVSGNVLLDWTTVCSPVSYIYFKLLIYHNCVYKMLLLTTIGKQFLFSSFSKWRRCWITHLKRISENFKSIFLWAENWSFDQWGAAERHYKLRTLAIFKPKAYLSIYIITETNDER